MSAQPIPQQQTTPVFAPDGTIAQIPDQYLPDAMSHGGKLAVQMRTPDGALHYVPHDQVRDAQLAGGKVNTEQGPPDAPKSAEGFWHSLGSVFGLTPEALQAAKQKAAGMNPVQEALSATAPPNPVDVVKNAGTAVANEFQKGSQEGKESYDALSHGDIKGFLAHQIGQVGHAGATLAAPATGENLSKAGEQLGQGNIEGAAGTTTGVLAPAIVDAGVAGVSKIPVTKIVKTAGVLGDPVPGVGQALERLQRFKDAPAKLRQIWAKQAGVELPESSASGPVPSGEVPAEAPKSVNADLPRTNSGEGVLNQALTSLDNPTLLKIAKSRGINVTKEAQLKAGSANGPLIKKIIDDFSPEELDDVRDKGIEASRNKPLPADGATPEAAAEAWRSKVLQTFFPDVKVSAAMQTRVAKTLQQQLQARFEAARAAAEAKANAVPVDDIQASADQGGHAGNGVTSVEELNRPGLNYVVSKSGQLTYQGKAFAPESTPNGASHVTVLPDGSIRVNAGPQLNASQTGALRFALKKQPWIKAAAAKAGD